MNIDKIEFHAGIERIIDRMDLLDEKMEQLIRRHHCIEGEELLDNQDLLLTLKVSHRTLQRYRTSGELPYFRMNGKIYYKLSDVNRFIREIFEAKPGRTAKQHQITPKKSPLTP